MNMQNIILSLVGFLDHLIKKAENTGVYDRFRSNS